MSSRWREQRPPDMAWRVPKGVSKAKSQREQDIAAGGREPRAKALADGRVVSASVCLRVQPSGRRIYAYLRWYESGRTRERYVGEVVEETRAENLAAAWREVERRDILDLSTPGASRRRPSPVSDNSRAVMRANKSKNTKPERSLRSAVYARGLRYRVHARPEPELRRTADMVFVGAKVAVFVDGCFWHGCPEHYRPAKRNSEFWGAKIDANRERDEATNQELERRGWQVVRVWEHEPVEDAVERIVQTVTSRRDAKRIARSGSRRESSAEARDSITPSPRASLENIGKG